jgi:hypothetical protein
MSALAWAGAGIERPCVYKQHEPHKSLAMETDLEPETFDNKFLKRLITCRVLLVTMQ